MNGHRSLRVAERLADEARFLKSWLEHPGVTGAVSPSGRQLARAMAAAVDPARPGPVIELGPGTGPVTEALLARGVAEERLVLVEFDPGFCALLARRFPRATVVQGDAYDLATTLAGELLLPAAAVVSSLPLLLRPAADRQALLRDAFALMAAGAPFVQFTYGLKSPLAGMACSAERSRPLLLNLPPAHVWVYREANAPRRRAPLALMARLKARTRLMRLKLKAAKRQWQARH